MEIKCNHVVLAIFLLNVLGLLFCGVYRVSILQVDLDVRSNFVELDRAGVINVQALSRFPPRYGFTAQGMVYRIEVPRYIAGPAIEAAKAGSMMGGVVAGINALGCGVLLIAGRVRRKRMVDPRPEKESAAG